MPYKVYNAPPQIVVTRFMINNIGKVSTPIFNIASGAYGEGTDAQIRWDSVGRAPK